MKTRRHHDAGKATDRQFCTHVEEQGVPANLTYYGRDGKVYIKIVYTGYEFKLQGEGTSSAPHSASGSRITYKS